MLRFVFAGFLIAHGLVHITVWSPGNRLATTDPKHSWILGDRLMLSATLLYGVVMLFALAGTGLLFQTEWWRVVTIVASGTSLVLTALFPGPILGAWIVAPLAIDIGLIVSLAWLSWPTKAAFGA